MIHRIRRSNYELWKPIWEKIVQPHNNCYIASTSRPTGTGGEDSPAGVVVPANKWAKVYTGMTPDRDGTTVVNDIVATLTNNEAQIVVFDELASANKDFLRDIAVTLRQNYPQFNGRWGTYVVFGSNVSYGNFRSVLTEFLKANAPIFPEFYINYIDYCTIDRSDYNRRDAWLKAQFEGNSSLSRFKFLDELRTDLGSSSPIAPIIAVTDTYNDGATPFKMIDRVMWGFINSSLGSKYGYLNGSGNPGGIGTWKWDQDGMNPENTGRGDEFVDSWISYCKSRNKNPRSGTGFPVCAAGTGSGIPSTNTLPSVSGADKEFVTNVRAKPLLDNPENKIEKNAGRAQLYRSGYKPTVGTIEKNPAKDTNSVIDLYITEINYGYAIEGQDHVSKYYSRFYPTSAVLRDVAVTGLVRDEREYEDLAYWIRNVQSDIARGYISHMGLRVPATGIDIWGHIPNFTVSIGGYGNPVPVAIPFQFNMVIIKDNTDPKSKLSNDVGTVVAGFYNDNPYWKEKNSTFAKDWYVGEALARINEVGKTTAKVGTAIKKSTQTFAITSQLLQDWLD